MPSCRRNSARTYSLRSANFSVNSCAKSTRLVNGNCSLCWKRRTARKTPWLNSQQNPLPNSHGHSGTQDCQRAENGGLDPLWLDFAFLGRPDAQSRGSKILILKGFGTSALKIRAPKSETQPRQIQAPCSRPSEIDVSAPNFVRICCSGTQRLK